MSFQNVRIVAVGADKSEYFLSQVARGDAAFEISSSSLREFSECPEKFKAAVDKPPTPSMKHGELVDCYLLDQAKFADHYVVHPDTYPAGAKSKKVQKGLIAVGDPIPWNSNASHCTEWDELNIPGPKGDRLSISQKTMDQCLAAVKRIQDDNIIKSFLDVSDRQVWLRGEWHDGPTGMIVPAKCLIDLAPAEDSEYGACIGDLKTARTARVDKFQHQVFDLGYHIQGLWNLMMHNAATGATRSKFCFIVQENKEPWQPARRILHKSMIEIAGRAINRLMANYCSCLKTSTWPGFDDNDESVDGWTEVRAMPYMEEKELFGTKFKFAAETETANDPPWIHGKEAPPETETNDEEESETV